ncbi:uncharacterized protein LOC111255804 [Setaria italica]|uniref:uncharacterized protein LOC111255804 n=1 Tax=Setaria italica TaxID=4555 RepID=UPI000BE55E3A|nr:uncharacterized protein LOC111255804 [Setaria italica]
MNRSVAHYCKRLYPDYEPSNGEENEADVPLVSLSGMPIAYDPRIAEPIFGADAPQGSDLPKAPAASKRKPSSKLLSKKKKKKKATIPPIESPLASEANSPLPNIQEPAADRAPEESAATQEETHLQLKRMVSSGQ